MRRLFNIDLLKGAGAKSKRGKIIFRATISLLILGTLLWWLSSETLLTAIKSIPLTLWILVITGFLFGHFIASLKWRMLLHVVDVRLSTGEAARAHGAGLFANLCLPSVVGGDLVRAAMVIRGHRKVEAVALGSLADRVNDTFALVALAAIAGLIIPGFTDSRAGTVLGIVVVALLFFVILGLVFIRYVPIKRLPARLHGITSRVKVAIIALLSAPKTALVALLLSISIQASFVLLNSQLASAIGISIPMSVWFLAWPLAKLVALVPVSLGGIGVREAALAVFLTPFGVDAALAVAQSLTWEAVLIFSGMISGLAVNFFPGKQNKPDQELKGETL